MIWGEEHFVGEDAAADVRARVEAAARSLAGERWLALEPIARGLRWTIVGAGPDARSVYDVVDARHHMSRPPTPPLILATLVRPPATPWAPRRDRASRHQPRPPLTSGMRLRLILEDWLFIPAVPGEDREDVLLPEFVAGPAAESAVSDWLVDIQQVLMFEDGWTLAPRAIDLQPESITAVMPAPRWDPATALPALEGLSRLRLSVSSLAGRIPPNRGTAAGASLRLTRPKFYRCPHCGRRTRIEPKPLVPDVNWKGPASAFAAPIKERFDAFAPAERWAFDFACGGCGRPVRVRYDYLERGMGGPWDPVLVDLVEVAPDR